MSHTPPAEQDPYVFCFSDIVDSTELWEADSSAMYTALTRHNEIIRTELPRFSGQEVKALGDGFFLSFAQPLNACKFCLTILKLIKEEPWNDAIVEFRRKKDIANGFVRKGCLPSGRGLVLRMGMNYGAPHAREVHPETGKVDYYGRGVNKTSRIESQARPEEVAVSDAFIAALYAQLTGIQIPPEALDDTLRKKVLSTQIKGQEFDVAIKGERKLKGIEKPEYITTIRLRR